MKNKASSSRKNQRPQYGAVAPSESNIEREHQGVTVEEIHLPLVLVTYLGKFLILTTLGSLDLDQCCPIEI